jgi:hypothetical protein
MNFLHSIVKGKLHLVLFSLLLISALSAFAQPNQGRGGRGQGGRGNFQGEMSARIYGKILDSLQNTPLEYVVIRVLDENQKLINGALSERNGDFSVDKIPVHQPLLLELTLVGFKKNIIPFTVIPSGSFPIEKDMGNLKLGTSSMKELVITDDENGFRKEFDKSIYDVVQVDQDGNVSVRNTAPQIFVDGRPTTMTIDQIPADAIQKVEVITNPSAKYDASGGGGGIINIVMKKNRSKGYNGSIRSGMSSVPPEFMKQFDNPYQ